MPTMIEALSNLGMEIMMERSRTLPRAISLDPRLCSCLHQSSRCQKSVLGHYKAAITQCDKALARNADNAPAYTRRGVAKRLLGDYEGGDSRL